MRTPITLKIKFKSATIEQFIERYSVDISKEGIFIRTKEPLAVGSPLKFEFQLQDATSLIAGDGTVIWNREPDPARTGLAPGMGVRFDKLTASSQQVLDRILAEKAKRGDAAVESRYDAGLRASRSSGGTIDDTEAHTPLPSPMPGLGLSTGNTATHQAIFPDESTRVMKADQARELAEKARGDGDKEKFDHEQTVQMDPHSVQTLLAGTRDGDGASAAPTDGGEPIKTMKTLTPPPPPKPKRISEAQAVSPEAAEAKEAALSGDKTLIDQQAPMHDAGKVERVMLADHTASIPVAKNESTPAAEAAKPTEEAPRFVPKLVDDKMVEEAKKSEAAPAPTKKEEPKVAPAQQPAAPAAASSKEADSTMKVEPVRAPAKKEERKVAAAEPEAPRKGTKPVKKSSAAPVYIVVALVAASIGGYFLLRGGDNPQGTQATAANPTPPAPSPTPPPEARPETPPTTVAANPATPTPPAPTPPATNPTPSPAPAAIAANPPKPAPTENKGATATPATKPAAPGVDIEVTTTPPGATVTLDGNVEGASPVRLADLDTKKTYQVSAMLKGYKVVKSALTPKAGAKLAFKLVPTDKVVEVSSTPAGADVILDGKKMGKTPTSLKVASLDKAHKLEVKHAGYTPDERSISATDTFENKGDQDVLSVAVTLAQLAAPPKSDTPKPANETKNASETKAAKHPRIAKSPKTEESSGGGDKTAEPAAEKPAAEKPAAEEPPPAPGHKIPSWMKKAAAPEGAGSGSAPSATP